MTGPPEFKKLTDFKKLSPYSGYPRDTVSAGTYMVCLCGQSAIQLTRSYDPKKGRLFLRAHCTVCGKEQTVYDHERGTRGNQGRP